MKRKIDFGNYWIDLFQREGIPCSKINSVDEALESEQAKANNMVLKMDHLIFLINLYFVNLLTYLIILLSYNNIYDMILRIINIMITK